MKPRVITHKDPLALATIRKDYELLGFMTSPIRGDSFTVYTTRPRDKQKQKGGKHKKRK
jgi:hypothetical protein